MDPENDFPAEVPRPAPRKARKAPKASRGYGRWQRKKKPSRQELFESGMVPLDGLERELELCPAARDEDMVHLAHGMVEERLRWHGGARIRIGPPFKLMKCSLRRTKCIRRRAS